MREESRRYISTDWPVEWEDIFMKKWYDEEYEFTVEVIKLLHSETTEHYCRNGEEVGT